MLYIFSIIAAGIGLLRPLWGFGIFLLANSGAAGFFEKLGILGVQLGPFRPENMAMIGTIAGLWLRRSVIQKISPSMTAMGILLWIITVTVPLSRGVESGDLWLTVKMINYALLWAPLFVVLQKLTPSERSKFHNLIIAVSTLTAFLTVVTVVSGSNYLYQILSIYRFGQMDELKPSEFITARITLPGLWSCAYLGLWFSIKELISQKENRKAVLLYGAALALMIVAFLFNVSRTIIMGISSGLFVVTVMGFISLTRIRRTRFIIVSVIVFATVLYSAQRFEGLSTRYEERFSTVNEALTAKTDKNKYMLGILVDEIPVLGHKDDGRDKYVGGDPHTFIRVWWDYGTIVGISLVVIFLIGFLKLFKVIRRHKSYPREIVATAICMLAFFLQLQFEMVAGYYLFPEALFTLIVFFAEIAVVSRVSLFSSEAYFDQRRYDEVYPDILPKRKIRITW